MNIKYRAVEKPTDQISIPRLEGYDVQQLAVIHDQLADSGSAFCVTLGNQLQHHSDPLCYDHLGIVKALRELCRHAQILGMEIWVIPCNDYTITGGLFRLKDAVGMSNFGFAWNILRSAEQGQMPQVAVMYMKRLGLRHVFLENGIPSQHPDQLAYEHRPLEQGAIDLAAIVQNLLESGYEGSFSAPKDDFSALCSFLESIVPGKTRPASDAQLAFPMPEFLPPPGHPRVYFRTEHIPSIKKNLNMNQNAAAYVLFMELVNQPIPTFSSEFHGETLGLAEVKALYYALYEDIDKGKEAITILKGFCQAAAAERWDYNQNGETVYLIAVVYDWCYSLLDADTKQYFYDAVIRHAQHMEVGYPPLMQGSISGHGAESPIMRDLMAAGIAMFDEFPNIYQNAAGRFFLEFIEPRQFIYQMHCFHQGNEYAAYRMKWELLCTWIFDRIGYPQVFGPEQHETLRNYLYVHRPDGVMLANGDCNNRLNLPGQFDPHLARTLFLGANYWKDTQMKAAAMRMLVDAPVSTLQNNQCITPVEFLLFNDPELEPSSVDELPWVHFQPAPKGGAIIRTGWHDGIASEDVLCELKLNEYFWGGHQHLDAGAFQIYYKGLLASDDGYYQSWMEERFADRENSGYSGYGSLHHYNYLRRTIAHNCMLVYDPEEEFRDDFCKVRANDGGQRIPNRGMEPMTLDDLLNPQYGYRTGSFLTFGQGQNYVWLKGDLTKAYSQKVQEYQRSFCFLRLKSQPAALVVYDRIIASDPSLRKTWLCHGLSKPLVQGSRAVFRDTRRIPGSGRYCGQYSGQLTVDTLLPERPVITAIGGAGAEALVDGINYFAKVGPNQRLDGHGYRLEVSPSGPNKQDHFLHVLHIGDVGTVAKTAHKIENNTHVGVMVEDRLVLFGKGNTPTIDSISITLQEEQQPYTVVIGDLYPGIWEINGMPLSVPENGIAEFTATQSHWQLRRRT